MESYGDKMRDMDTSPKLGLVSSPREEDWGTDEGEVKESNHESGCHDNSRRTPPLVPIDRDGSDTRC